jgi:hypothetical protein
VNANQQTGSGDPSPRGKRDPNRRVIDVSCSAHGGSRGFVPLVVTKRDGDIELNPHATDQCVIVLDEKAATQLFDILGEWLG